MASINLKNEISTENLEDPWKNVRLSKDVLPIFYSLFIHPNLEDSTFEGNVLIEINVNKATNYIILHQTQLDIKSTTLTVKSKNTEVLIESATAYPANHYWVIKLGSELNVGIYDLFMTFKGNLGSGTLGLYKTTYLNADDKERPCMLSYFEPTYARSAFPCFDEPGIRAKFAVKIAHENNGKLVALSNMCRDKETLNYPRKGVNTVHFRVSPSIPPYLVALIVGEFTYTEPVVTKRQVSVAVYSRPELITSMIKARDLAALVLDFFSDYFDFPYPLAKLDLIGYPNSNIGGMENWGMISFREDLLILNEKSTCDDILSVLSVICHEISHMWFGDLVCIEWWDNLWLKEGFATFMAFVAGSKIFPEWHQDWVVLLHFLSAFQMDASLGSHPIVQPVSSTSEIREVFDAISYEKGSCLIRMIQDVAPKGFELGIKSYIQRYKYSTAVTENLWDEIQSNVDFDLISFINTWTNQMGFPVLNVEKYQLETIIVSQSRFMVNKNFVYDPNSSPYQYKWDVPIKYISSEDSSNVKLAWLMKDQESVALDVPDQVSWVKLNWHLTGFYRVNYPISAWEVFSNQLLRNSVIFDVEDRVSLIDDAFNLASSGYFFYHVPLNLIKYLQYGQEKHFFPWAITSKYLYAMYMRLIDTDCLPSFMNFVRLLLKGNLSDDIWDFGEDKTFHEKKLQSELIKIACWAEEESTLQRIKELFSVWISTGEAPHFHLTQLVYSYGLAGEITQEEWDTVLNRCLRLRNSKDKFNLWRSLGNVTNKNYLIQLLELAKDENNLMSQDFFIVLTSIAKHPVGLEVVWNFIRDEWKYLVERFTLEDMGLCRIILAVCSQFGTKEKLNETKEFFGKYPDAGAGTRSRQRALELIDLNIQWLSLNYLPIVEYLNA